jgi:seryl-tRNA synthetase
MLDIQALRNDLDGVVAQLKKRGFDFDAAKFSTLEQARKTVQTRTQDLQAKRNNASKQIGMAKAKGEDVSGIMAEVAGLGDQLKADETRLNELQSELQNLLLNVPNLPHASVPDGKSEADNLEVRRIGTPRVFDFEIKDHADVGAPLGLDFDTGAKLSGARFTFMRGQIAKLHRALAQFMLDTQTEQHGYTECYTPYLVNAETLIGTGQLPKFEEDLFSLNHNDSKLYLIPTSEVGIR